jgi:ATP-dependent Zn protease
VVFVLILLTFQFLTSPRPHTIDYSNFLERVEAGQIVGTLEISQTTVSGRYEDSTGTVDFNTTIPPILQGTSTLTDQLDAAGINYTGETPRRPADHPACVGRSDPAARIGLVLPRAPDKRRAGGSSAEPRPEQGQDL